MGLTKVNQNTELFLPLYNDIQHNYKCVETSQLNISGRAPDPERMCLLWQCWGGSFLHVELACSNLQLILLVLLLCFYLKIKYILYRWWHWHDSKVLLIQTNIIVSIIGRCTHFIDTSVHEIKWDAKRNVNTNLPNQFLTCINDTGRLKTVATMIERHQSVIPLASIS